MDGTGISRPVVLGSADGDDEARRALAAVLAARPDVGTAATPVVCPHPGVVEVSADVRSDGGDWAAFMAGLTPLARERFGPGPPPRPVGDGPGRGSDIYSSAKIQAGRVLGRYVEHFLGFGVSPARVAGFLAYHRRALASLYREARVPTPSPAALRRLACAAAVGPRAGDALGPHAARFTADRLGDRWMVSLPATCGGGDGPARQPPATVWLPLAAEVLAAAHATPPNSPPLVALVEETLDGPPGTGAGDVSVGPSDLRLRPRRGGATLGGRHAGGRHHQPRGPGGC